VRLDAKTLVTTPNSDVTHAMSYVGVGKDGPFVFDDTPMSQGIRKRLIDCVAACVPKSNGEHFSPHVTTGTAPRDDLDRMLAEPFDPFTFSPAGAAVDQFG
jgi:hypothetical protein